MSDLPIVHLVKPPQSFGGLAMLDKEIYRKLGPFLREPLPGEFRHGAILNYHHGYGQYAEIEHYGLYGHYLRAAQELAEERNLGFLLRVEECQVYSWKRTMLRSPIIIQKGTSCQRTN